MLYGRTNKKDAMKQIAKQVNRREALQPDKEAAAEHEELARTPLELHHTISNTRRQPVNLPVFVNERHKGQLDPAKKVLQFLVACYSFCTLTNNYTIRDSYRSFKTIS